MSTTIEVPTFWTFRMACSCPFGSVVADQSPHRVLATEDMAWEDFYEYDGKRAMAKAKREGVYVTPADEFDAERWKAGHSHPECTRPVLPEPTSSSAEPTEGDNRG